MLWACLLSSAFWCIQPLPDIPDADITGWEQEYIDSLDSLNIRTDYYMWQRTNKLI